MAILKNINQALEKWLDIAVDQLQQALMKCDIGEPDGNLMRSFATELVKSNGDVERVIIRFNMYGRFVDMGVGRGVPLGKRGSTAYTKSRRQDGKLMQYGRKPKPWYSKTKVKEIYALRKILLREYGIITLKQLEQGLKQLS